VTVKTFMRAIVQAFPKTGTVGNLLANKNKLYKCYPAKYGFEGFYFHQHKPVIEKRGNLPELLSVLEDENTEEIQADFEAKKFKPETIEEVDKILSLFTYKVAKEKPNYTLVSLEDLEATVSVKILRARGKFYKYYTTPAWMFSLKKQMQINHPVCFVNIQTDGRWRALSISRILRINVEKKAKTMAQIKMPKIKEKKETREDGLRQKIDAFLSSLDL